MQHETPPNPLIAFVGEAPGKEEVEEGRPFVGPSGRLLTRTVWELFRLRRQDFAWVNLCQCRPPNNSFAHVMGVWRTENKRRKEQGLPSLPTPAECCRPALAAVLQHVRYVIPLGAEATKAILDTRKGIMDVGGAMFRTSRWGRAQLVLPTLHPAFVLRRRRWLPIWKTDLDRAIRYFGGKTTWRDPEMILQPSPQQVLDFLRQEKPFWTADVETDAKEPLLARLRCISIGDGDAVMCIPFLSIDGTSRFYSEADTRAHVEIQRWFQTSPAHVKVGHNYGSYDRIVIERHFGVTPTPVVDTLVLHRLGWSELPHRLAFVGRQLTDVVAWKAGKTAVSAESDQELWIYCNRDVAVNARVAPPIMVQVREVKQAHLVELDHKMQSLCVDMHVIGAALDQGVDSVGNVVPAPQTKTGAPDLLSFSRAHWAAKLTAEADHYRAKCRTVLGRDLDPGFEPEDLHDDNAEDFFDADVWRAIREFNPISTQQLRRVLFDEWRLPPQGTTATGDPTTGAAALRSLLRDETVAQEHRAFIQAVYELRKRIKWLGYVKAWRFAPGDRGCIVYPDGRIHPHWNASGKGSGDAGSTTTGRLTSSPNFQNIPFKLRSCIVAPAGLAITCADFDQIELRLIAAYAGARLYLDVFDRATELPPGHPDGDAHRVTMQLFYGKAATTACEGQPVEHAGRWSKGSGTYKRRRDLAKRLGFLCLYGGLAPMAHRQLTSAEDGEGQLIYTAENWISLREVRVLQKRWLDSVPEIVAWWHATMRTFRQQGYLEEVVTGRRRYFGDGAQPKKARVSIDPRNAGVDSHLINFPIQAASAGLMAKAAVRIAQQLPRGFDGENTGIFGIFHDELGVYSRVGSVPEVRRIIEAEMTQTVDVLPGVVFTASAETAVRLTGVK